MKALSFPNPDPKPRSNGNAAHGVLSITLPKKPEWQPRRIEVQ